MNGSVKGREGSFNLTRLSFLSVISEEGDILYRDPLKAFACSPGLQILENEHTQVEGSKVCYCFCISSLLHLIIVVCCLTSNVICNISDDFWQGIS